MAREPTALEFLQAKIAQGPKLKKPITAEVQSTVEQAIPPPAVAPSLPADAPKTRTPIHTPPPTAPTITHEGDPVDDLDKVLQPLPYLQPDTVTPPAPDAPPVEAATPPVEEDDTAFDPADLISKDPKRKTAAHFRQTIKESREALKTKEKELEEARERIRLFETAELIPEPLQKLTQRVAELETYEQIYNVKGTPEYESQVGAPLAAKQERLYQQAQEYGIPPDVIDRAFDIDGEKDLNAFLMDNFQDTLGATEAKQLITDIGGLRERAAEFETKPKEALARLQERGQAEKAQREGIRRTNIGRVAKTSWDKAFKAIQEEGIAEELIFRPNDPAHNEKYAKPLTTAAIQEYSKCVKLLADVGIPELPENLATFFANMVLKAHSSAVALQTRKGALDYASELEKNARRDSLVNRPAIGATRPITPSQPAINRQDLRAPQDRLRESADSIMNGVIGKV